MQKAIIVLTLSIWMCSQADASFDTAYWSDSHVVQRSIPIPLADRPGNVYLDTETVWVKVPAEVRLKAGACWMIKGGWFAAAYFPRIPQRRLLGFVWNNCPSVGIAWNFSMSNVRA